MAFVDEATIYAQAGKGGDGVVRWARTKEKAKGGPSGGDGGKGGNVLFNGVRDLAALARYRYEKKFQAENGGAGEAQLKHGKNGDDLILNVPVGTTLRVHETGEEYEITHENEHILVFKGGYGGFGNDHFKSSTNQNPFEQTPGKAGQGGDISLTLKLIAEVGLIGLPNAGKSSLLNALTNAKSKVGVYPFTTLEPSLGDFYGRVIADIPGLIEGASAGKGLGTKFLKHIERTGILLHLVSAEREDPVAAYREVHYELESFGRGLLEKREYIVLSKTDLLTPQEAADRSSQLHEKTGKEVLQVAVTDQASVKTFADNLSKILSN